MTRLERASSAHILRKDLISCRYGLSQLVRFKTGFTTAISDTDLTAEGRKKVLSIVDKAEKDVVELIDKFHKGDLQALPGYTEAQTLEMQILGILNKARNEAGEIVAQTTIHSNTMDMLNSGARGNMINIAQMAALVGQQDFEGGRVTKGRRGAVPTRTHPGRHRPGHRFSRRHG